MISDLPTNMITKYNTKMEDNLLENQVLFVFRGFMVLSKPNENYGKSNSHAHPSISSR